MSLSSPSTLSAGEHTGVTMADILALPDQLCTLVTWLMRQPEAGLPEVAAYTRQDEARAHAMQAELVAQRFVGEVFSEDEGQLCYRVRLGAKRERALPLNL
jgi:hypothetical protein